MGYQQSASEVLVLSTDDAIARLFGCEGFGDRLGPAILFNACRNVQVNLAGRVAG